VYIAGKSDNAGMTYPGGKNGSGVYQKLINLMPPHDVYIEPFLGSGAILRMKRPAPVANIAADVDTAVVRKFFAGVDLPGLLVVQLDARILLRRVFERPAAFGVADPARVLVYCDPPYLFDVRSTKQRIYRHEYGEPEQHARLLDTLKELPCMVMISGYWSQLYADSLAGWRTASFNAQTRSGRTAREWVWMNFPEPVELHDYAFLGDDYRQRERIKRRRLRWRNRLATMPSLERYAILSEIDRLRGGQQGQE
jgi:hypothetical protein